MERIYTIKYLEERMDTDRDFYLEPGEWTERSLDFDMEDIDDYPFFLSRLIQEAGRFCDYNSCGLFEAWKKLGELLKNPDYKGGKYPVGFYTYGVDTGDKVLDSLSRHGRFFYRSVWLLCIDVKGNSIRMRLIKIRLV